MIFSKTATFKRVAFLVFACALTSAAPLHAKLQKQSAFVQEVLSGDTVRLKGGKVLRYAGIAAPPLQSKIPLVREYGQSAFEANKQLVAAQPIEIQWGAQIRDEHNQLLGYVFLSDGRMVNLELLKQGNARAKVKAPNLLYAAEFRKTELGARRQKLGLWKEEPENPFIKSEYIGDKNTKVFYFPTSPELERLPESYLVRFRSRVEAVAAGYKPCPACREEQADAY